MQISLAKISSSDGETMHAAVPLQMDEVSFQAGSFPVEYSDPLELTVTNTGRQVLELTARGSVTVTIPCDRCLAPVSVTIPLFFERKFDMKQTEEDRVKDLDESSYLSGYLLDVDQLAYLELILNWPPRTLCSDDCRGLCPTCGKNLNLGSCSCDSEPKDPRMAAISEIFSKFKEV